MSRNINETGADPRRSAPEEAESKGSGSLAGLAAEVVAGVAIRAAYGVTYALWVALDELVDRRSPNRALIHSLERVVDALDPTREERR